MGKKAPSPRLERADLLRCIIRRPAPEAIKRARTEFKTKYPGRAVDVDAWPDETFLNKARITIQGQVTNAALILPGRPESAALLAPAIAKMSWILKDNGNTEKDYDHLGPPFLLSVDNVFSKIRNLTIRHLPDGTLFPLETTQYDPWVLREAMHNCIAHQDYSLQGRINVVETPTDVTFSNVGSFLPGSVEKVIQQDSPPEIYRNPFLAEAMVQLNMIDTQGGGIKRMYGLQVKRFFPLPDYDLSESNRVAVRIRGEIIDERYTKLLISRTDIDLWDAILLDKVQKKQRISKEQCKRLRATGAVEGRYPNVFVSARLAKATGYSAQHILNRGLDQQFYDKIILELIREHGPVSRKDIDGVIVPKLPEILTEKQKKSRVHNMLSNLARKGQIENAGSRKKPGWVIAELG